MAPVLYGKSSEAAEQRRALTIEFNFGMGTFRQVPAGAKSGLRRVTLRLCAYGEPMCARARSPGPRRGPRTCWPTRIGVCRGVWYGCVFLLL